MPQTQTILVPKEILDALDRDIGSGRHGVTACQVMNMARTKGFGEGQVQLTVPAAMVQTLAVREDGSIVARKPKFRQVKVSMLKCAVLASGRRPPGPGVSELFFIHNLKFITLQSIPRLISSIVRTSAIAGHA